MIILSDIVLSNMNSLAVFEIYSKIHNKRTHFVNGKAENALDYLRAVDISSLSRFSMMNSA